MRWSDYLIAWMIIVTSPLWLFALWLHDAVLTFAEQRERKARKR